MRHLLRGVFGVLVWSVLSSRPAWAACTIGALSTPTPVEGTYFVVPWTNDGSCNDATIFMTWWNQTTPIFPGQASPTSTYHLQEYPIGSGTSGWAQFLVPDYSAGPFEIHIARPSSYNIILAKGPTPGGVFRAFSATKNLYRLWQDWNISTMKVNATTSLYVARPTLDGGYYVTVAGVSDPWTVWQSRSPVGMSGLTGYIPLTGPTTAGRIELRLFSPDGVLRYVSEPLQAVGSTTPPPTVQCTALVPQSCAVPNTVCASPVTVKSCP